MDINMHRLSGLGAVGNTSRELVRMIMCKWPFDHSYLLHSRMVSTSLVMNICLYRSVGCPEMALNCCQLVPWLHYPVTRSPTTTNLRRSLAVIASDPEPARINLDA